MFNVLMLWPVHIFDFLYFSVLKFMFDIGFCLLENVIAYLVQVNIHLAS